MLLWAFLLTIFGTAVVSSTETINGKSCYFPFTYRGDEYTECAGNGPFKWCYTSENYTVDYQWSYCIPEPEPTTPSPPKETCVFPFLYKGKSYETCITDGNFGQHWCSTTDNYDEDRKWKFCEDKKLWPKPATTQSPEEQDCVFPFVYRNESRDECITTGNFGKYWCATTDNYDRDGLWRNCKTSEEPRCVFPFTYNETAHDECTDAERAGLFWCSTTEDYDMDGKWRFCTENMPEPEQLPEVFTVDGDLCVFPFYYKGKRYDECTGEDSFRNRVWCSLTTEYDGNYGYCDVSKK